MTDPAAARERLEAECALVKGTTFLRRKAYVLAEDVEELLTEFDRRGVALQEAERERDKALVERDGACDAAEKAEEEARGFAVKFLEAGKACIDAEDALARSLGLDPDALPSGEAARALADLAANTARIQAKPCATFVSREPPGTMGASCVHCGFPAAHHRIEPTDYAELMEYGERARAAEARCVQYEQALRELIGACAPPVEALVSVHSDGKWIDPSVVAALVGARDELRRCVVLLAAGSGLGGEATAARPRSEHDHELHCAYANGASAVCNCRANLAAGEETS